MKSEYVVWYWDVVEERRRSTVITAKSWGEAREKFDLEMFDLQIVATDIDIQLAQQEN